MFVVIEIRIGKIQEMCFYLIFCFFGFKVADKLKVVKISDFLTLSSSVEKYKPALSKSDSSWDNLFCMKLVIVCLDLNVGMLQFLVSAAAICAKYLAMFEAIYCCDEL